MNTTRLFTLAVALLVPLLAFAQTGDPLPGFSNRVVMTGGVPSNGTSEVQTLTLGGTPTGGTFRLAFSGDLSPVITWSATNATLIANVDAAIEAMPTIGVGGVTTAAGTLTAGIGTITLTFTGNVAKLAVPLITVSLNSLTGTAPTLGIVETTPGVTADGRSEPRGRLLINIATGILYTNRGVPPNPTWTSVNNP